jgi:hypothetical protein
MTYRTRTVEVEVEVNLEDFDTEDLIQELEDRGHGMDPNGLLTRIYEQRKMGHCYERELDELIWQVIGRMN